jgi:hypothetical protein
MQLGARTGIEQMTEAKTIRSGVLELFIVGAARSGTTFLLSLMNCSPDIFLFSELNAFALRRRPTLYASYGGNNFVDQFNNRKAREGNISQKGAFIANSDTVSSVDDLLESISSHYKLVGEKIALSNGKIEGTPIQQVFLEEHLKHHFQSWHFLIFREPIDILSSAKQHFPNRTHKEILENLIITYDVLLQGLVMLPRSLAFFYEDMHQVDFNSIFDMLQVRRPFGGPIFHANDRDRQNDSTTFAEIKEPLDQLVSTYREIKRYAAPRHAGLAFGMLGQGYRNIRESLHAEHAQLTGVDSDGAA